MNRPTVRRYCLPIIVFAAALLAVCAAPLAAAPPWETLAPFKKVEAEPDGIYPLAESNGPWLIMATTFRGENAQQQARDLVHELRQKHRLPAYTYEKTFDFSKTEQGRGVNPDGTPKKMRYQQGGKINEVAVMVGDYQAVDDPGAQRTLAKIKGLEPDSLRSDGGKSTSQSLASFRQLQSAVSGKKGDGQKKGPMGHAFIATNPLLPREYFAAKGVDKLVLEMNKDVPYSLLDCRGQYSVQVATFSGAVLIDQRKIQEVEKGKKLESKLADAAEKAHKLTTELRELGYEAYEFHDRESSIVTIGSFNSVGAPRADGKIEINPTVHKIMQVFGADQSALTSGGALKPKTVGGVPLDIQPLPIEVPRRSIATDYQRSMLNER